MEFVQKKEKILAKSKIPVKRKNPLHSPIKSEVIKGEERFVLRALRLRSG